MSPRFPWPAGEMPTEDQARDWIFAAGFDANDDDGMRILVAFGPVRPEPGWRITLIMSLLVSPPSAWTREPGDDDDEDLVTLGKVIAAFDERRERIALGRPLSKKLVAFLARVEGEAIEHEEVDDGVELPTVEELRRLDIEDPLPALEEDWRGWLAMRWEAEQEGLSVADQIKKETERLHLLRRRKLDVDAARSEQHLVKLKMLREGKASSWRFYNERARSVEAEIKELRRSRR